MLYDVSKPIKIDLSHDERKYIELVVAGEKIKIPNWYSYRALSCYFNSYKENKSYRKAFCSLVLYMLSRHKDKEKALKIEDIEQLSDFQLIRILKSYLKNNQKLNKYFKENFNNNYFETFFMENKKEKDDLNKIVCKGMENIALKVSEPIKQINFSETAKQFQEMVKVTMNFTSQFQEIIRPITKYVEEMRKQFTSSQLFKDLPEIIKRIEEFKGEFEQYKKITIMLGFPPHMDLLPKEISEIVRAYNTYGKEKAEKVTYNIYIGYYNYEKIKNLSTKWYHMDILKNRKQILRQAVYAHFKENYYLSIPIVFSQLEGIIANTFKHKGKMHQNDYINYLGKILNDNKNMSFDGLINNFYATIVLASFNHNEPIKSVLSRHAIMHGADTKYGTKINSIKALLLFDYIINKIDEFNRRN